MIDLRERPPAARLMCNLGKEPDPWQLEVLQGNHPRLLLHCCRQAGKSTVVDMLGLAEAIFVPGSKVLLVSRSHRQSKELFTSCNHALAVLRYLISRLDHGKMARAKRLPKSELSEPLASVPPVPPEPPARISAQRRYFWENPDCWTRIF